MSNNRSVLRFNKYIVERVVFEANEDYFSDVEDKELPFDFDTNTTFIDNRLEIELSAIIFKNAVKNNYPFEMQVVLKGFFEVENGGDIRAFEMNAIAILFPYLRAIVSTYTANSNVVPVLLPAMNINAYLKKKYEQ